MTIDVVKILFISVYYYITIAHPTFREARAKHSGLYIYIT
jgi:hypothetical protein